MIEPDPETSAALLERLADRPIAAQFPGRAAEIQRGSINSVEPEEIIDIETTMEGGRAGLCYHYFKLAKDAVGKDLSMADWRLRRSTECDSSTLFPEMTYLIHDGKKLTREIAELPE